MNQNLIGRLLALMDAVGYADAPVRAPGNEDPAWEFLFERINV
jgi:hypothetical protein